MRIARFEFQPLDAGSNPIMVRPSEKMENFQPAQQKKPELPPLPSAPITYSEEQLKSAEQEGYRKGFLDGTTEGRAQVAAEHAEIEKLLDHSLKHFLDTLAPLMRDHQTMVESFRTELPAVALAIAKKAAGSALDANAETLVSQATTQCLNTMLEEHALTVRVHPSLHPTLMKKLETHAARLPNAKALTIFADETLQLTDCVVEWKHGMLEQKREQIWGKLESIIAAMIESAPKRAQEQIENVQKAIEQPGDGLYEVY